MIDKERLAQPLVPPLPEGERCFRMGIVLNGTVSAGAWSAGALDGSIEVVDAWAAAKAAGEPGIPDHRIRVEMLGGASGGGVCAAIFARAASRNFPHGEHPSNPFWQVWVEALDLLPMLGTDDLQADQHEIPSSALSGGAIKAGIDAILTWGDATPNVTRRATPRAWLADPFHVGITLTNLRGVPIGIEFQASDGSVRRSHFMRHADHIWFAIGLGNAAGLEAVRADQWPVSPDFETKAEDWRAFADYARATAAFPIGFPPVKLLRQRADYDWRGVILPPPPDANGNRQAFVASRDIQMLTPRWDALPPEEARSTGYSFFAVDGGATNNQPLEMVREGMLGLGKSLPREPHLAKAAILLIDPFSAEPTLDEPPKRMSVFGVGVGLLNAGIAQSRYATCDLFMALDGSKASRFMLTAGRKNAAKEKVLGGAALASSDAGAFLGFLDREYRRHDFLLGRQNMIRWLQYHFRLPPENPIFGQAAGGERLPIIPRAAAVTEPVQPDWPDATRTGVVPRKAIRQRTRAVVANVARSMGSWVPSGIVGWMVWWWKGNKIIERLRDAVAKTIDRR